jgi:hypothetical protein
MLRAGLYARISTNDQQTLAMQNRAMREYGPTRLDDCHPNPESWLRNGATRGPETLLEVEWPEG